MLSSVARPLGHLAGSIRASGMPKVKAPSARQLSAPGSFMKSLARNNETKRYYAGHHHHEEAPKPYKRTTLAPKPADAPKSPADLEREVKGIEGWIFGRKVTYMDPLKPLEDTAEQKAANGYMWNLKPRGPGEPFVWYDWEPVTYAGTIICILIVAIGLWARPETNIQIWATEEARERKIIKARRELENGENSTL